MAAVQVAQALPELRAEFARGPDDRGLCRALRLEAAVYWIHGRAAAADDAWRRAAEYARRANDRKQLTEILGWLASAALWGPTPAVEGIRRCADYFDEVGNHPRGQVAILNHLAGLQAMQDQAEAAQVTLRSAKSYLDRLGPTMTAAVTQPAAFVAMLAGDPATAETYLRFAYDTLSQMGEKDNLSTEEVLLARAVAAQGQARYGEARELVALGRQTAAGEDLVTEIIGQGLSARMLADDGRHAEAAEPRPRRWRSPRRQTC